MARTVGDLINFQEYVTKTPLDHACFPAVQRMFSSLGSLEHINFVNTIRLKKLRACIMLSNGAAWNWLLTLVPNAIRDIVYNGPQPGTCIWLGNLVASIRDSMISGENERTFHPEDCGLILDLPRAVNIRLRSAYELPGEEDPYSWYLLFTRVISDIMEVWLDYPSADKCRNQGVYVLNLVHTLSTDFLYLDVVWEKYKNLDALAVYSTSMPESITPAEFPLLTPTSDLRKNVQHIARLVEGYVTGQSTVVSRAPSRVIKCGADSFLDNVRAHQGEIFKRFVFDCFTFLVLRRNIADKKLQKWLTVNPDKFSMFRECSPTRINMLKDNGPFSPEFLWTKEGFFSALVCRGVTFGTPFARRGRTLFKSPKDFDAAIAECPGIKLLTDYCDQGAYGRNNPGREPGLVPRYWKEVLRSPRPGVTNQEPTSFREFFDFLQPPKASRFPHIGPLASYLLTVDYVYAGAVLPADGDQLARLIYQLDKGPARSLENLAQAYGKSFKYAVEDPTPTMRQNREDAFVAGFLRADKLVKEAIPLEYHGIVRLDLFTTEHALCKFSRLGHLGINLKK